MSHQRKIPKETGWDHSIELLREGYYFILNRTGKFDSRVVLTRILGAKTICMVGKKEAELFYDTDKFYREEAAPTSAQKTILGQGGVQGLDGEEHRHRKAMFMSLMTKEALNEIQQLTKEEWQSYINKETDEVEIYEAAKVVLTRIALRWTGVPYKEEEVQYWASNLSPLFEYASKIGPKNIKSRWSRQKLESKLEDLIQKVRKERINVDRSRAFYQFSMHKDLNGELLDQHIAAVELLNLIRPLVAIAVYINFTFLGWFEHPEQVKAIKIGELNSEQFIQEVRRYYPFFPFVVARVRKDFTWNNYIFKKDTVTFLDLYGTNHDPKIWNEPDEFKPTRFNGWEGTPFDFIPQGGGEFDIGHRCAGEWITIKILKTTLEYFINEVTFEFPDQEPEYQMNDIPPKPKVIIKKKG